MFVFITFPVYHSFLMTENHSSSPNSETAPEQPKPRILIGSQRNPEAYKPKPVVPVVDPDAPESEAGSVAQPAKPQTVSVAPSRHAGSSPTEERDGVDPAPPKQRPKIPVVMDEDAEDETSDHLSEEGLKKFQAIPSAPIGKVEVPGKRGRLSSDLAREFEQIFGETEMDSLMQDADAVASKAMIEPETKTKGKILRNGREHVFIDLGSRNEGMLSLKMFSEDDVPVIGAEIEVIVVRFLAEEGLYELTRPLAAADVKDWAQVHEGMVVDAVVTKANTGGVECQVNRLRGFIPISQLAQFRVEKPEDFVGQKLTCVVIECDPASRNLVLSRRAMIDREREELRQKTLTELEQGQTREGVVRKIIDVGAFVDLGGVDGFIHISTLSWGRVRHPGDILQQGQRVKVKVLKIDHEQNRISLSYRDDSANPWTNIFERFQEKTPARGKVSKVMDFGAFVEMMPGVEGLVHISELSHKRVGSVGEVVREGDWVDVYIQSIDVPAKRISLSMKQLMPEPVREETPEEGGASASSQGGFKSKGKGRKEEQEPVAAPVKFKHHPKGPLKGGTSGSSDGAQFGLKW